MAMRNVLLMQDPNLNRPGKRDPTHDDAFTLNGIADNKKLNLVIGYPLKHSQSPLLHNALYHQFNLNYIFLAMEHTKLNALINVIKTGSVTLTAVTSPYKEKIISYLDRCSPEVNAVGAANTVIQKEGKLYGYNTDIDGIAFAFHNTMMRKKKVLVIGAGGAACAMGYFLKKNQAKIFWLNRTQKKSTVLAKKFGGDVISHDALNALDIDIIINTTPVGMFPDVDDTPLRHYTFKKNQVVFDMVYNPIMTHLLSQAKKHKAKIISGLEMFIGQGLKQNALLTGERIHDPLIINKLRKMLIQNQRAACR